MRAMHHAVGRENLEYGYNVHCRIRNVKGNSSLFLCDNDNTPNQKSPHEFTFSFVEYLNVLLLEGSMNKGSGEIKIK